MFAMRGAAVRVCSHGDWYFNQTGNAARPHRHIRTGTKAVVLGRARDNIGGNQLSPFHEPPARLPFVRRLVQSVYQWSSRVQF